MQSRKKRAIQFWNYASTVRRTETDAKTTMKTLSLHVLIQPQTFGGRRGECARLTLCAMCMHGQQIHLFPPFYLLSKKLNRPGAYHRRAGKAGSWDFWQPSHLHIISVLGGLVTISEKHTRVKNLIEVAFQNSWVDWKYNDLSSGTLISEPNHTLYGVVI